MIFIVKFTDNWDTLGHTSIYWDTLVYTGTQCDTLGHTSIYWDTMGHTGTHCMEHTGTNWETLGHTGTNWDTMGQTGTQWDLPNSQWYLLKLCFSNNDEDFVTIFFIVAAEKISISR